jgi:hypothetical protein
MTDDQTCRGPQEKDLEAGEPFHIMTLTEDETNYIHHRRITQKLADIRMCLDVIERMPFRKVDSSVLIDGSDAASKMILHTEELRARLVKANENFTSWKIPESLV